LDHKAQQTGASEGEQERELPYERKRRIVGEQTIAERFKAQGVGASKRGEKGCRNQKKGGGE